MENITKITDKLAALPDGADYFSLEFFPPKTTMVRANRPQPLRRSDHRNLES